MKKIGILLFIGLSLMLMVVPAECKELGIAEERVYYIQGRGERGIHTQGLEELIQGISSELKLKEEYIRAIAIRLEARYRYRDADITRERTENRLIHSTEVEMCPIVTGTDMRIRGTEYYLPDCLWTLSKELSKRMTEGSKGREDLGGLYDADKERIIFYEEYEGLYDYDVDTSKIKDLYIEILKNKEQGEEVITKTATGEYEVKPKFKGIFKEYGIENTEPLAQAMSLDSKLKESSGIGAIKEAELTGKTYEYGVRSRENLLRAGLGLVGKVRYVWGGGHGVQGLAGYNPIWFVFNDEYSEHKGEDISPSGSWCPIHKDTINCAYRGETIRTIGEYKEVRGRVFNSSKYWQGVSELPDSEEISRGVGIHRLEGLDCSGFCSWLYSQVDTERVYDSSASRFIESGGLKQVGLTELEPGDIASWSSHIVCIVGKQSPRVYLVVESTKPTVKLGVYYITGATQAEIGEAKEVAKKYNKILGGIPEDSGVSSINLVRMGARGGRLAKGYIDDGTGFTSKGAEEILEQIAGSLPWDYVWGLREGE